MTYVYRAMLVSRLCPVETAYFPIAGVLAHTRQLSWILPSAGTPTGGLLVGP